MESIEEHYKFRQMISCRNKLMPKLLISQSALNFSKRIWPQYSVAPISTNICRFAETVGFHRWFRANDYQAEPDVYICRSSCVWWRRSSFPRSAATRRINFPDAATALPRLIQVRSSRRSATDFTFAFYAPAGASFSATSAVLAFEISSDSFNFQSKKSNFNQPCSVQLIFSWNPRKNKKGRSRINLSDSDLFILCQSLLFLVSGFGRKIV